MSIYFDFDVGPTGRKFRRAVDGDKNDIQSFSNASDEQMFGNVDIGSLIELTTLSICMINNNKDVVGFMALCDHPNVAGVDPADWEIWIRNMYQKFYLSRNTIFIHFMCYSDSVADYFLSEALISVFMNDFYLLRIVLLVPYVCPEDYFDRFNTFKKYNVHKYYATQRDDGVFSTCFMYVFVREEFCPKLKMRRAVEEDNDDIVEILDKYSLRLREMYGSFYISEIIGRHPESNRTVLVADINERAVGVICLNLDINYKKLQKLYELQPFHGLRKATTLEKEQHRQSNVLYQHFGEPIIQGTWSAFDYPKDSTSRKNGSSEKKNTPTNKIKKLSKVNFRREGAMRKSIINQLDDKQNSDESSYKSSPSTSLITHTKSFVDLLDEETLDYEIVNIDKTLLTVPGDSFFDLPLSTSRPLFRPEVTYTHSKKKKTVVSNTDPKQSDVVYQGGPNAFMIELFGLREDIDERCAFNLLTAAFELMDDYDYCIIRVPCSDKSLHSLLQHFCFVPTRSNVCCEYALYVAHRCSVLGNLRVREVELIDIPQITYMLHELGSNETIWSIENSIVKSKPYSAFVFFTGLTLVGIAILEQPEAIDYIRTKFTLDSIHCHKYHFPGHGIRAGFASLKTAIVYPAFEPHFRFFAREIMRLSGCNTLLWLTAYKNKWIVNKLNSMVAAMIPLRSRTCEMDCANVRDFKKMQADSINMLDFSAWYIGRKITSIPKVMVTTRIVVVGASRTATSFLNTLFFSNVSSYLTFTNVTLISSYGLPIVRSDKCPAALMFLRFHSKTEKYLKSIPYTYYMNVVYGTMADIDRQGKFITLGDGTKYSYDYLVLLFGKQYQHPDYLKPAMKRDSEFKSGTPPKYVRLDVPRRIDANEEAKQFTTDEIPRNVFIINHITVAQNAINYVRKFLWSGKYYKIIVYGSTIHAYCCLTALLEVGVSADRIVFVEPFPPEDPTKTRIPIFNNVNVDQTVKEVLKNLNITVYRSYYFQEWFEDINNLVTHVKFLSHFQIVTLECSVFFYYGKRAINARSLIAINKCGMAYHGGILIDNKFNTNDPSIYAAGPATRYYSRYFALTSRQRFFDSSEIGEKLGTQIIHQLDPLFSGHKYKAGRNIPRLSNKKVSFAATSFTNNESQRSSSSDSQINPDDRLPELVSPIYMYCVLPGGLQYLEVRPPGKKIPHHYIQSLQYNGIVLETFKSGYFKLHLNKELIVDGITCLTYEKYSFYNLKKLYGMSAIVLNNIHLRFAAGKVDNFYEYFRSPWSFFLYYDQSDDLFAMAKELLPKGHRWGQTIRQALRAVGKKLSSVQSLVNDAKVDIQTNFDAAPYIEAITQHLMEWVAENDVLLPMYLQPLFATEYMHGLDHHPAFKRKKQKLSKMISKVYEAIGSRMYHVENK